MKKALAVLGLLISVVCLILFAKTAAAHWQVFATFSLTRQTSLHLIAALLLYMATYAVSAQTWSLSLRLVGSALPYLRSLHIIVLSQIGKYLPGNVAQHVGRVLLASRESVSSPRAATSVVAETFLLMIAAFVCSLAAADLLIDALRTHGHSILRLALSVAGVAIGIMMVALLIPTLRHKVNTSTRKVKQFISLDNLGLSLRVVMFHVLSFVLGAAALWIVVGAVIDTARMDIGILGVYAIAWLIGFVVPGAPAGLGVREALLVLGLGSLYGVEVATAATALFRAITVIGDGLVFLVGISWRRR